MYLLRTSTIFREANKNHVSIKLKEVLGGILIKLKQEIDTFLFQLDQDNEVDSDSISKWIKNTLDKNFLLREKGGTIQFS